MYPHRIRLRGPWVCQPLAWLARQANGLIERRNDELPPTCPLSMPCRWGETALRGFIGRVRLRRRFGIPRRIDSHERVWLTIADGGPGAEISLNGQFLGKHEGRRLSEWDVTSLLQERNELALEVETVSPEDVLCGDIALEVRCSAFLRALCISATHAGEGARLHVRGEVVGDSASPLEIYVILGRSTVAYATVVAVPAGQPFHLLSETLPAGRERPAREASQSKSRVQIDLVSGGVVWYSTEMEFDFVASGPAAP